MQNNETETYEYKIERYEPDEDSRVPFPLICVCAPKVGALNEKFDPEGDGENVQELYEFPNGEYGLILGSWRRPETLITVLLDELIQDRVTEILSDIEGINRLCKILNYNCRIEIIDSEICVIKERRSEI